MTSTDTTILLDIYQRLGTIEEQLRTISKTSAEMEKKVEILEKFEARVGAYLWVGGSIVSGVLFLLWEGLTYMLPAIRTTLGKMFS